MKTYCNPLNLHYQYQHYGKGAHREAADPTLILFKGRYYLFASMSGGFYYSDDLLQWKYHRNRDLELYHYAPDAREINGKLVFCASYRGKNSVFLRTDDPMSDTFECIEAPFPFWDPNLFQDDDGRVYLYWGCDCGKPLYGQEFDPETLAPVGEKKELIWGKPDTHGWERRSYPGREKQEYSFVMRLYFLMLKLQGQSENDPYIEGSFMNKWNGKYYFQYAGPATEVDTYGDGVYIGDGPLGPFTYQQHNPFSAKPGGFITAAGHGSTIEDKFGNLWHASTMHISDNANFERRVGLFPAGLDEDGILYCNQSFSDYPLEIPEGRFDPRAVKPKWMLLSYKKPVTASSSIEGHGPELAADENIKTSWCAEGSEGEWLQLDLGGGYQVHAVQINFADVQVPVLKVDKKERSGMETNNRYIDQNPTLRTAWTLEGSVDGTIWEPIAETVSVHTDLANDYIEFERPMNIRYLRLTVQELPYGKKAAVSGLRVFGVSELPAPEKAEKIQAIHTDPMSAKVCWAKSEGATGYNVRYGIAPNKLYLSHMVYEAEEILLTMLNAGQEYYLAVDAFGEGGITAGDTVKIQ